MDRKQFVKIMDNIELQEDAKQDILEKCMRGKRTTNKVFLYSKQIAAACIVGGMLLTSVTAYAAVSAYQEYMSRMSVEELEDRYTQIQSGTKEADSFSRTLTQEERARLDALKEAYQQGLRFPEESMECVNGMSVETGEIKMPVYDYTDMIFYLPDRTLTDEELLQVIDVWEKGNYSLAKVVEQDEDVLTEEDALQRAEDFMAEYKHKIPQSDEERLQFFAEELIQRASGGDFDLSALSWEFVLYGEENAKMWVTAESDTDKYSIFFTEDSTPDKLTVLRYRHALLGNASADDEDYSEEQYRQAIIKAAEQIPVLMTENMGIHTEITKAEIYGRHYLVLTDSEENRYRIVVNPQTGDLHEFLTYEAGAYDDVDLSGEQIQ
ncbi:MAG: hypothetical protein K6G30_05600 [Acetatifactor sp.]|nr:hypothetical protein [Acetatifactor sp.]